MAWSNTTREGRTTENETQLGANAKGRKWPHRTLGPWWNVWKVWKALGTCSIYMPTLLLDALHGAEDIEEPGRARGFGCHRRPAATNLLPTFFLLFFSTRAFFFFLSLSLFQRASVASFPLQPVEPFHRFSVSLALHGPPRPLRSPLRERDFLRVFFPSSSSSSPSSSSSSLPLSPLQILFDFCFLHWLSSADG